MKRFWAVLGLICGSFLVSPTVFAGVNDFYFSDFTGDYYLSRDDEGISHLRVKESVTAVFPDYKQNKGICRQIPFTNQKGENVTLPSLTRDNLTLTRNGSPEAIYSIEKEGDYYSVCTGTDEYVLGEQTYVFEYEFEKVVTEFDEEGRIFQELYWDTNGNGATQRFGKVTARLHFDETNVWTGESWCYVGKHGENGQERCKISQISDGVEFQAENLSSYENLTFDVELKPGSFVVPEPEDNYTLVWLAIGVGILCVACMICYLIKYSQSREKGDYYKGIFVAPQYQPHKKYSLPEMAEIYLEKKKDAKVAMLLELIVQKKISLKQEEDKKNKWSMLVNDLGGVGEEYIDLLTILNDGTRPKDGDSIKIERHTASNRLITLKTSMESKVLGDLKRDKLVEQNYKVGGSVKKGLVGTIVTSFLIDLVVLGLGVFVFGMIWEWVGIGMVNEKHLVFYDYFYFVVLVLIVVTTLVSVALNDAAKRYAGHTMGGLEMSRYMEGLKLYIEMAEAERIKFLQGVKTADVSAEGIVKLYEKLLPYAAVFGLEESWINEMKQYCEVEEIETPDYLVAGLTAAQLTRSLNNAATYATNSTVMTSSGGSSSSGFSGGGGGGFSGGGGGGGGFSGR